jgi:hypothetical protein
MPVPVVINFGHVLSDGSVKFLQEKIGTFTFIHERLRIDFDLPLSAQIAKLIDRVETKLEWDGLMLENCIVYIVTPGLTDPSLVLLVDLFGRSGQLPKLLPMRKEHGVFVIYDIIDLERVKLMARGRRKTQVLSEAPPCPDESTTT